MDSFRKKQLDTLVKNIKALRAQQGKDGWTQTDLADACGFNLGTIKQIESKTRFPRPETLEAIAGALKVDAKSLLDDSAEKNDDLATKVFEKMKGLMAPAPKPHLQSISAMLDQLDATKDKAFISALETMLASHLAHREPSKKKKQV